MKKRYYIILALGIGILLLYYLSKNIDLSVISNLSLRNIFYLLVLSILSILTYVLSLRILLEGMGYKTSPKSLYLILTSSLATNYVNPVKIGLPLRVYLYKKVLNIPLSVGTASLGIEIFIQIFLLSIVSIIAIMNLFTDYSIKIPLLAITLLLILFCSIIFFEPTKLKRYTNRLPFENTINRLIDVGNSAQDGIKRTEIKSILLFSFLIFVMYIISAIRLFVILMIFGVSINPLHVVYVQFISGLLATVSMIPMGLGIKDASIVVLLMNLGIPNEVAISAALIERTLTTGLNFVLGAVSASALGIKFLEFRKVENKNRKT